MPDVLYAKIPDLFRHSNYYMGLVSKSVCNLCIQRVTVVALFPFSGLFAPHLHNNFHKWDVNCSLKHSNVPLVIQSLWMWSSYVQKHYWINLFNMVDSVTFMAEKYHLLISSTKGSSQSLISSQCSLSEVPVQFIHNQRASRLRYRMSCSGSWLWAPPGSHPHLECRRNGAPSSHTSALLVPRPNTSRGQCRRAGSRWWAAAAEL